MADNIAYGSMFTARGERKSVWHQLGTYVEDIPDVFAAATDNGMRKIIVEKWPHLAFRADANGEIDKMTPPEPTGTASIMRRPIDGVDPDWRVFCDRVAADYPLVQVDDLCRLVDGLAKPPINWKLSTLAALGHGETTFFCFETGRTDLKGTAKEALVNYFVVANWNDGGHALAMFYSPIRVVCQNTLNMGLRMSQLSVKLPHLAGFHADIDLYMQLMTGLQSAQERTLAGFEALYDYRATADDVSMVLHAAYANRQPTAKLVALSAMTGDASLAMGTANSDSLSKETVKTALAKKDQQEAELAAYNARMKASRSFARQLIEQEREDNGDAGALWLAVNAVAEAEQFSIGQRQTATSVAMSAAFGDGSLRLSRAGKQALAIVEGKRH